MEEFSAQRRAREKETKTKLCVACTSKLGLHVCSKDNQRYCLTCLKSVDVDAALKFAMIRLERRKAKKCVSCDCKRGSYVCPNDGKHYCLTCLRRVDAESAEKFAKTRHDVNCRYRTQKKQAKRETSNQNPVETIDSFLLRWKPYKQT